MFPPSTRSFFGSLAFRQKVLGHLRKESSTSAGGNYRCSFHESGHYHGEVTMAIKENKNFIKTYKAMLKWNTSEWHKQDNWLKTNKNCPMGKDEPPSIYLVKFFNWLSEKIKSDATRHVESRVGHEQVG